MYQSTYILRCEVYDKNNQLVEVLGLTTVEVDHDEYDDDLLISLSNENRKFILSVFGRPLEKGESITVNGSYEGTVEIPDKPESE